MPEVPSAPRAELPAKSLFLLLEEDFRSLADSSEEERQEPAHDSISRESRLAPKPANEEPSEVGPKILEASEPWSSEAVTERPESRRAPFLGEVLRWRRWRCFLEADSRSAELSACSKEPEDRAVAGDDLSSDLFLLLPRRSSSREPRADSDLPEPPSEGRGFGSEPPLPPAGLRRTSIGLMLGGGVSPKQGTGAKRVGVPSETGAERPAYSSRAAPLPCKRRRSSALHTQCQIMNTDFTK